MTRANDKTGYLTRCNSKTNKTYYSIPFALTIVNTHPRRGGVVCWLANDCARICSITRAVFMVGNGIDAIFLCTAHLADPGEPDDYWPLHQAV